jgi:hypothetical protein
MDSVTSGKMDVDKANAICNTAKVIVSTVEAEVKMLESIGGKTNSDFYKLEKNSTIHRIKG